MVAEPVSREIQIDTRSGKTTRRPRNLSLSKVGVKRSERLMRRSMSCDELAMCRNRARSPAVRTIFPFYKENSTVKTCLLPTSKPVNDETSTRTPKRRTRNNRCRSSLPKDRNSSKENTPDYSFVGPNSVTKDRYCVEKLAYNGKTCVKKLISFPTNSLLHSAVVEGDIELAQRLLMDDPTSVNKLGQEGTAPLHEAAINGDLSCLELLITYNADLEVKDKCGRTAVEYAVFAGNFDCASLLLRFGANDEKIRDGIPCL